MSYTKGEFASAALEEIGLAEYEFDISPEQKQSVIGRLDMMMAEWNGRGIKLSYPISMEKNSSSDEDSNTPDWSWEAIITNLAIRIAPSYGKTVAVETKVIARHGYTTLCSKFSDPREMQLPSMPKGAGYKVTDYRYTPVPSEPYLEAVDEEVDLSGGPTNE